MLAQILSFLALAAVAVTAATVPAIPESNKVDENNEASSFQPMAGVDPNTLTCDPKGEVFLLLPHFHDCSKFYMCAHGNEVEFSCPANLVFDFVIQGCNWKSATECVLRVPKEDIDLEGSGMGSGDDIIGLYGEEAENGPIDILTAESSGTMRPISAISAQQFNGIMNCNRADSSARQLPYKNDCQRYWKCVSGVPQAVYCTDGLFFNESTQQCDFEANAKCTVDADNTVDELKGEFIVYE